MDTAAIAVIIVVLARLLVPLTILRYPLIGGILAIITDISDVMVYEAFGTSFLTGYASYHQLDKLFDTWYLFLEFLVVMRWKDKLARNAGIILFLWRAIGFLIYELTGYKQIFFFAPNIFEFFFLACLVIWKFNKKFKFSKKSLIVVLLIVGIPNIIKEYLMHYKYPDQTWNFLKEKLFWWIYD